MLGNLIQTNKTILKKSFERSEVKLELFDWLVFYNGW